MHEYVNYNAKEWGEYKAINVVHVYKSEVMAFCANDLIIDEVITFNEVQRRKASSSRIYTTYCFRRHPCSNCRQEPRQKTRNWTKTHFERLKCFYFHLYTCFPIALQYNEIIYIENSTTCTTKQTVIIAGIQIILYSLLKYKNRQWNL